ncbi:hypothetical protein ACHAWF_006776 [Thalassiosira exigua]
MRHSTVHPPPASLLDGDPDPPAELTKIPSRLPPSYNGRNSLFLFSRSEEVPAYYSVDLSTQENYGVEHREFWGPFRDIRAQLDYDYHGNYVRDRQEFHDKIVEKLLDGATVRDEANGLTCKTPTEPWIVFTAGTMVRIVPSFVRRSICASSMGFLSWQVDGGGGGRGSHGRSLIRSLI